MGEKSDPIRLSFNRLEKLDWWVTALFYITTVLSIIVSYCSANNCLKESQDAIDYASIISLAIIFTSLIGFGISLYVREYKLPLVQDIRVKDNFSSAFGASFGQERTDGYYNNPFKNPDLKVAAQTLENVYFTGEILSAVLWWKTLILALYVLIGIYVMIVADIPKVIIAFQFLISEPVVSSWIKAVWLKLRCTEIFNYLVGIFKGKPDQDFICKSHYSFTSYEMAKSHAGIILPSKTFDKLNPELSTKWDGIIADLAQKVEDD